MKNYDWLVEMATGILDMAEELEQLRMENADLREYRKLYAEELNRGIEHGQHMMAGFLQLAMKPGVMEAIGKANKVEAVDG